MVQEARQNEAADKKRREVIEVKNTADNLVYQTEKALRELGDKVPSAERGSIETKINELKQAAQGDDIDQHQETHRRVAECIPCLEPAALCTRPAASTEPEGGPSSNTTTGW